MGGAAIFFKRGIKEKALRKDIELEQVHWATNRSVEWPVSRPLMFEPEIGPDYGGLDEWPLDHVVKVLCFCHPADDAEMWAKQEDVLTRLFHACRCNRLEMLLEVIPSKVAPTDDETTATLIQRIYDLSIYPDW